MDLQKLQEVFCEQEVSGAKCIVETNKKRERLRGRHIVFLGERIIGGENMEILGQKYLNVTHEKMQNLLHDNFTSAGRNVIRYWARRNPGPDQVTVLLLTTFGFSTTC